jgi:hypothetical protein
MSWVPMETVRRSLLPRYAIRHDAIVLLDESGTPIAFVYLEHHTWERVPKPVYGACVRGADGVWMGDNASNSTDLEAVKRWVEEKIADQPPYQLSLFS